VKNATNEPVKQHTALACWHVILSSTYFVSGIWTLIRIMTSFRFPKNVFVLLGRVKVIVKWKYN